MTLGNEYLVCGKNNFLELTGISLAKLINAELYKNVESSLYYLSSLSLFWMIIWQTNASFLIIEQASDIPEKSDR